MRFLLQLGQALRQLPGVVMQHRWIDFHAVAFNAGQHGYQRHLNMLEHIQRTFVLLQFWPHFQVQLQRNVSVFRRVASCLFESNLVKGELIFPFAGNLFEGDRFVLEPAVR